MCARVISRAVKDVLFKHSTTGRSIEDLVFIGTFICRRRFLLVIGFVAFVIIIFHSFYPY